MAVLFIGVNARNLLYVDDIAAMRADKAIGVKHLFKIAHRPVLQEGAVMGMDLDIVIGGLEIVDVFEGDDLDLAGGLDDDALLLGGR